MTNFDYSDETMIVVEELYDDFGCHEVLVGYDKLSHQFFTVKYSPESYDHDLIEQVYYYNLVSDHHYYELTGFEYPVDSFDPAAIDVTRSPGSLNFEISGISRVEPYKATVIPPNQGRISIPTNIIEIRFGQYFNRNDLLRIHIPMGIKRIGAYAFYGCDRITEISLPESIEEIGPRAFMFCTSLESVHLPNHAIKIGYDAFSECKSLSDVFLSTDYISSDMLNPNDQSFRDAWFNSNETTIIHFHVMDGNSELFCLVGKRPSLLLNVILTRT